MLRTNEDESRIALCFLGHLSEASRAKSLTVRLLELGDADWL